MPRDKRIELVHGYGPTLTRDLPVSGTGRTAVIAVNLARLRSAGTQSHGATARYVTLPYEAHGYAARESNMHVMAETLNWLDKYVKRVPAPAPSR